MSYEGWLERVIVHVAMILVGAGYGGYFALTKASLSGRVDPFVFYTYRDGIGCITLFLYAIYFERQHWRKMSLEVAGLILAMAVVGVYLQQALFLYGLQYTNVVFAFQCILIAAIFGLPGTTVSLGGFVSVLQGWEIDLWRLGALCLIADGFFCGAFVNFQVPALKSFPASFTLMSIAAPLGVVMFATTALLRVKFEPSELTTPRGLFHPKGPLAFMNKMVLEPNVVMG